MNAVARSDRIELPFEATAASRSPSAVSWAAVLAGATVAAATALTLSVLIAGIDLASVSPWRSEGASGETVAVLTAIGLIISQWLSSSVGGYISGRLRTKWVGTHGHEVFFRDTAHGFITWCVATLIIAAVLASTGKSVGFAAAQSTGAVIAGAASSGVAPYELDVLFRTTSGADNRTPVSADTRLQVTRALAHGLATGDLSPADRSYIAQTVATQTGISDADAQARVDQIVAQTKATADKARATADAARKSAELGLIFTALSMIIGAFIASISAALGGRLRDLHP